MTTARTRPSVGRRPWTTVPAAGVAVVVAAIVLDLRGTLLAVHPAYPVLLGVLLVLALAVAASGLRRRPLRRGRGVTVLRWLGVLGAALVTLVTVVLTPYRATGPALAAMADGAGVEVAVSPSWIELRPDGRPTGGFVFYPGVTVDARAHAAILRPLAERGVLVVIVKAPLGIAPLARDEVRAAVARHPGVGPWVVGAHSLGTLTAPVRAASARAAGLDVRGLVLWAGCPTSSVADSGLVTTVVLGSRDGVVPTERLRGCRELLPPGSEVVELAGVSHVQFGDYGPQAGDLAPRVGRAEAQRQILAVTWPAVREATS